MPNPNDKDNMTPAQFRRLMFGEWPEAPESQETEKERFDRRMAEIMFLHDVGSRPAPVPFNDDLYPVTRQEPKQPEPKPYEIGAKLMWDFDKSNASAVRSMPVRVVRIVGMNYPSGSVYVIDASNMIYCASLDDVRLVSNSGVSPRRPVPGELQPNVAKWRPETEAEKRAGEIVKGGIDLFVKEQRRRHQAPWWMEPYSNVLGLARLFFAGRPVGDNFERNQALVRLVVAWILIAFMLGSICGLILARIFGG